MIAVVMMLVVIPSTVIAFDDVDDIILEEENACDDICNHNTIFGGLPKFPINSIFLPITGGNFRR